mgnify:CR=1 FL=1
MKIAFDAQLFLKGNKTGIAWCADNVIKELAKKPDYECECDFFALGHDEKQIDNLKIYEKLGVKLNPCKWFNNVIYKLIWPIIPIPYSWFFGDKRDITIFFNFIVPPGVKGKTIAVVHDMAYKAYPETVNTKTRKWLELTLKKSCKRADLIVTVSEFSKKEIIKYLGVPEKKIVVMPNGVDLDIYHPDYPEEDIEKCKSKYHIEGEYFLYLGTLEPRKNLVNLVKAYDLVKKELKDRAPKLVLAGGKGWYYDSIFETVEQLGLREDVIFTGYVPEEEVPLLMNGAKVFVFPSLYEGFGMPPLEAMACGTPVIVSNTEALQETIGNAGICVDAFDISEFGNKLIELFENSNLREILSFNGLTRARQYIWKNMVYKLEVYLKKYEDSI